MSVAENSKVADGSFDLKIASSGQIIHVPKDKTTLQAMLDAGLDIPFSCETGVCGTCLTAVVEGEPEHHDQFLTAAEHAANDIFTPCCSRSNTKVLVVDI